MSEDRERCPVCGKAKIRSWSEAKKLAKSMHRHMPESRGVYPYWSFRCRTYHIGEQHTTAYRKARRKP